jgi:hypothetical protein
VVFHTVVAVLLLLLKWLRSVGMCLLLTSFLLLLLLGVW